MLHWKSKKILISLIISPWLLLGQPKADQIPKTDVLNFKQQFPSLVEQINDSIKEGNVGFLLKLDNSFSKLDSHFVHLHKDEFRELYMRIGKGLYKINNINSGIDQLLKAHELINESKCDEWVWYIENPLMNRFNEKKNFEKANYYAAITENCLKANNDVKRLCGLYSNLGDLSLAAGELKQAELYYKKGLTISLKEKNNSSATACYLGFADLAKINNDADGLETNLKLAEAYLKGITDKEKYSEKLAKIIFLKSKITNNGDSKINNLLRAIQMASKSNKSRNEAEYRYQLAKVYHQDQNDKKAILELNAAISLFESNKNEDDYLKMRILFLRGLAILDYAKDTTRALLDLNTSLDICSRLRSQYTSGSTIKYSLDNNRTIINTIIDLYYENKHKVADVSAYHNNVKTLFQESKGIAFLFERKSKLKSEGKDIVTTPPDYIEYLVTDDNVYAYANSKGAIHFEKLCSTKILEDLTKRYLSFMKDKELNDTILHKCYDILLKPIFRNLPGNLIIIPDGLLTKFSFEAFKRGDDYLIFDCEMTYHYSSVNLGNVFYEKLHNKLVIRPDYGTKDEFLRSAADEIKEADKVLEFKNECNNRKTIELTLKEWANHDIVHFIGHAQGNDTTSFLYLCKDINLSNNDVKSLKKAPKLVLLSACETSLGKFENGEGVNSIGKNIMESGTHNVIQSLWAISDVATSGFMQNFYNFLSEPCSASGALRKTKLNYLKHASMQSQHPYYWSGLICYGEQTQYKFSQNKTRNFQYAFWSLLFLLSLYFFIKNKI